MDKLLSNLLPKPTTPYTLEKQLQNDYILSNDPIYRSAISTVMGYKISTLTSVATLQNQTLLNQISTLKIQ